MANQDTLLDKIELIGKVVQELSLQNSILNNQLVETLDELLLLHRKGRLSYEDLLALSKLMKPKEFN